MQRSRPIFIYKTAFFILTMLFFNSLTFSQEKKKVEGFDYNIIQDSIFSKHLNAYRILKISLPLDYNPNEKHPVFYTLDAEWMFEPTATTFKNLTEFGVSPKSIVVGVFHKNRNEDLSKSLKISDASY